MKIRNYYAYIFAFWVICVCSFSVSSVVSFVNEKWLFGIVFLILTTAFAFVAGMLLIKAIEIYKHNKACDYLKEIAEAIIDAEIKNIKPFEDFDKN
jgi:hypothetical protein